MNGPIEELYFNWLCAKVSNGHPTSVYEDLLKILHSTEFVWLNPGDRHRCLDGIELRDNFLREAGLEPHSTWFQESCSVFELLLALADRASFQTDMPVREWFWRFIQNLGLEDYRRVSRSDMPRVEGILNTFIWRTYDERGNGGLFPLQHEPKQDQREVELWYQFFEYLDDQGLM